MSDKVDSLFDLYRKGKIDSNILNSQEKPKITEPIKNISQNVETTSYSPVKTRTCINTQNLIVNSRQKGNPVLSEIRNIRWEYSDEIEPDFIMSRTCCGLFLSLEYHLIKPNYIYNRMKQLKTSYQLRILLCIVDITDSSGCLRQLSKLSVQNDFTMVLGWSNSELARYLESYKSFENKPPDLLMSNVSVTSQSNSRNKELQTHPDLEKTVAFLTSITSVNKTDARILVLQFRTIAGIMKADLDQLRNCPGLGPLKARNIYETFHQNISRIVKIDVDKDSTEEDNEIDTNTEEIDDPHNATPVNL